MKFWGLFLLLASTSASFLMSDDGDATFLKYLSDFNITSYDDYRVSKRIFMENLIRIREHNQRFLEGKEYFEMGVNKFAHMSIDDLKSYSGGARVADESELVYSTAHLSFLANITALPSGYDWRSQNKVTPVQDQVSSVSDFS